MKNRIASARSAKPIHLADLIKIGDRLSRNQRVKIPLVLTELANVPTKKEDRRLHD